MDEVLDFLKFSFENNPNYRASSRLSKKWTRFDRPFRIEPSKKAA
jgi:hypothetical protein